MRNSGQTRATAVQLIGEEGAGPVGRRAAPRCGSGLGLAHEKEQAVRQAVHGGSGKTKHRGGSLTDERRWWRQGGKLAQGRRALSRRAHLRDNWAVGAVKSARA
jgi:hypothetical protein